MLRKAVSLDAAHAPGAHIEDVVGHRTHHRLLRVQLSWLRTWVHSVHLAEGDAATHRLRRSAAGPALRPAPVVLLGRTHVAVFDEAARHLFQEREAVVRISSPFELDEPSRRHARKLALQTDTAKAAPIARSHVPRGDHGRAHRDGSAVLPQGRHRQRKARAAPTSTS